MNAPLNKLNELSGVAFYACRRAIHTLDWSCQVPANFAVTLAQRVSVLPQRK